MLSRKVVSIFCKLLKNFFKFRFLKTKRILFVWVRMKEKHIEVVSQCYSGAGVSRHRLSRTPREITTRNKETNNIVVV